MGWIPETALSGEDDVRMVLARPMDLGQPNPRDFRV
jgi:hypothetical protein